LRLFETSLTWDCNARQMMDLFAQAIREKFCAGKAQPLE
jgi:hypothetical protein